MAKTEGVQIYDILPNGCLNGTYANDGSRGEIFNEVARKRPGENASDITGKYDCFYFDLKNESCLGYLEIKEGKNCQYEFTWSNRKDEKTYKGQGWKNRHDQIMLKYQSVK